MAKKIVKKRKLKIVNILIFFLVIGLLSFCGYLFSIQPIKNIIITGTSYINDDEILESAGVKNYPSFFMTNSKKIEKELNKNPYIESVLVKKSFYNVLNVKIKESKALFINNYNDTIVFSNKEEVSLKKISYTYRIPRLINYVPDKKYDEFINGMKNIKEDTLGKISDIEYVPNEYDKDRFLLYMDDGNMVYLTLTKFKMINYYNDVLSQLENKKGILYLDSGNHFQIRE